MEMKIEVPVVVTPKPFNMAIVREALLKAIILLKACEWPDDAPMQDITEVMDEIEKALSVPARNCDVGPVGEQAERFWRYCNAHSCNKCPARGGWRTVYTDGTSFKMIQCGILWAQMPYNEGGAK